MICESIKVTTDLREIIRQIAESSGKSQRAVITEAIEWYYRIWAAGVAAGVRKIGGEQ